MAQWFLAEEFAHHREFLRFSFTTLQRVGAGADTQCRDGGNQCLHDSVEDTYPGNLPVAGIGIGITHNIILNLKDKTLVSSNTDFTDSTDKAKALWSRNHEYDESNE